MDSPSERTLGEPLRVIRLHHPRFAPLDSTGARLFGGRWNSPGADVVYAALSYGGALLETRVHAASDEQPPREIAVIVIPAGVRISELTGEEVHGWDRAELESRAAGDAWIAAGRTVGLIVPSKAGAPLERNIVLNLSHADARTLQVESRGLVPWDARLFSAPATPRSKTRTPHKKK